MKRREEKEERVFHAYSATPTRYVNGTRETVAKLSSKRFYDLSYLIHGVVVSIVTRGQMEEEGISKVERFFHRGT